MSRREDLPLLIDIEEAVEKIGRYTLNTTLEEFSKDEMTVDAVFMNLIVIGETANKLSETLLSKYPEVDWYKIKGLRNRIAHDYKRVNLPIVWEIIQTHIPILKTQLKRIREAI
jgi:uncharacterized protein with HEPN domain